MLFQKHIEQKYKHISKFPDKLLSFTFPIRKKAVSLLNLKEGQSVLDIGCGTGASFEAILEVIGQRGHITGIDASHSMISVAQQRITNSKWDNIDLITSMIEDTDLKSKYDGALLFAMHDVFNSEVAIRKIHSLLKEGSCIVCVGPKKQKRFPRILLNPMLDILFKRMAVSQENKYEPWKKIDQFFKRDEIMEEKHRLIFIYVGRK